MKCLRDGEDPVDNMPDEVRYVSKNALAARIGDVDRVVPSKREPVGLYGVNNLVELVSLGPASHVRVVVALSVVV
jgi:hypothetical protein